MRRSESPREALARQRRNALRHVRLFQEERPEGTVYGWSLPAIYEVGGLYESKAQRDADAIEWGVWCEASDEAKAGRDHMVGRA